MSGELNTIEAAPVAATAPVTPMTMLSMAVAQGADLDKLQKLMDLQERWEANEARKAFNADFAAFKSESIQIIKNIDVTDGPLKGKKYADLFGVVSSVTPALSKHNLSASWKMTKDEKDWIEMACVLRHALGHFETFTMGGPPDVGGAKNAIQARASSVNYLERYTFLGIVGLAAQQEDKDGRNADFGLSEESFQCHIKAIKEAKDIPELQKAYEAAKLAAKTDKPTLAAIIKAKDERKAALRGAL